MSRPMTPAMAALLAATVKSLAIFMQGDFASGTVRIWSGLGSITWAGQTWLGTGGLVEIGVAPETEDVAAQSIVVTVSGADPALLASALNEGGHHFAGALWLAMLDASGAVIADPLPIYAGQLDTLTLVEAAAGPTIQITYANRLADLERPRSLNYTDADQQRLSPGDLGFSYVAETVQWTGAWGQNGAAPLPSPASGLFGSLAARVSGGS